MHPKLFQSKPWPSMNSLKDAPCFLYLIYSYVSDDIPLVDRVPLVVTLLTIVTLGGVVALIGLDWRVLAFNAALAAAIFDTSGVVPCQDDNKCVRIPLQEVFYRLGLAY